ncbi:MAG TPA: bifunctional enoyl-CoA hydratase/phosphate acetyltransferase [Usitatibacter sp.]|nr:bifunctional enoyl-CoA hydratase/phosphate acetyltransferase [Usitatibacter sp.]
MNDKPTSPEPPGTLESRPFDEIRVGDQASLTRTLTLTDVKTFAVLSGDLNPTHVDERFARKYGDGRLVAHSMLSGALVSSVLGNELPGPGTRYVRQDLRFLKPLHAGDTITATVVVREKRSESRGVVLDCACVNQLGEVVAEGSAEVVAPSAKVVLPRPEVATISVQTHDKFAAFVEKVKPLRPLATAVAHPCSDAAIKAAVEAAAEGIIEPILVGPVAKVRAAAAQAGVDLAGLRLVDAAHSHDAAEKAVALVRAGEAGILMKGSLHTDELLEAVVKRDTGLRTERRLSHAFLMDVPTYHKPLIVTDAAINITPTLSDKADICRNAIDLAHVLGIARPKVAILSAVESVNEKIVSTTDAASLCKMAERGQIPGALLDGPLAMDNAISREAAEIKGIVSEVAGDADILVVPDLVSGNMIAKQLTFMANADAAGIVLGARVPIVLTSRADSVRARLTSCALAVLLATSRGAAPEAAGGS